jgi:hypothetical protein
MVMAASVHTVAVYEFGTAPPVGFVYATVIAPAAVADGDAVTPVGGFTELSAASGVDGSDAEEAMKPVEALAVMLA